MNPLLAAANTGVSAPLVIWGQSCCRGLELGHVKEDQRAPRATGPSTLLHYGLADSSPGQDGDIPGQGPLLSTLHITSTRKMLQNTNMETVLKYLAVSLQIWVEFPFAI